jgi:hypothetical protein
MSTMIDIHGLGADERTVHEYFLQCVQIHMKGFACEAGADLCEHVTF